VTIPATDAGRSPTELLIVSGSSRVRTPAPLNHAIYADRHRLRSVFDVTPSPVDPIFLHKVAVIRRHLPTTEWLFWIDDDAFFTDPAVDLRAFIPDDPSIDLVFCASPVNPAGGWTWMSAGQFLLRNTPRSAALLDAVLATDLRAVRAWWDADELGLFTRGDQDAFVHELRRGDGPWAGGYVRLPWEAFNSRPYHYVKGLDEHFVCHFAVPGGRSKMDLIRDFADRLGTNTALVPDADLERYATFIGRSEMAGLLGIDTGRTTPPVGSSPPTARFGAGVRSLWRRRIPRGVRRVLRSLAIR
jgi:hypothetical protein